MIVHQIHQTLSAGTAAERLKERLDQGSTGFQSEVCGNATAAAGIIIERMEALLKDNPEAYRGLISLANDDHPRLELSPEAKTALIASKLVGAMNGFPFLNNADRCVILAADAEFRKFSDSRN